MCTCNKEHLTRELFVYVLKSYGLVKVVKEKYCQITRTQEQIKPVKEKLFVVQTRKRTRQETCQCIFSCEREKMTIFP